MSDIMEFRAFPKVPRWKRDIVILEKLDGSNASVWLKLIPEDQAHEYEAYGALVRDNRATSVIDKNGAWIIRAGSRNGFVWPGNDNYGFAAWVWAHAVKLTQLREGIHYGEWWGHKIQRGYGQTERHFSLFNTSRWGADGSETPPDCCLVVPQLYSGPQEMAGGQDAVEFHLRRLAFAGSQAAPGFKNPEGVVIYHTASRTLFKKTIGDDGNKGQEPA
jgi:hypothetical protein